MIRTITFAMLLGASLFAQQKLTLIREFPGSTPPHLMVEVEPSGKGVYKEGADSEWPIKFQLTPEEAKEVFDTAARCGYFNRELESGLKVAFMGTKTFRWEDGAVKQEVKFNYTMDEAGKAMQDWLEKMAETEQHYLRLERAVKYDKLGVNQALLLFNAAYDKKRIVAIDQFLPLLDRVAKNESYLHMARERAAGLGDLIRAGGPPPAQPKGSQ
ncbi:hypothetical protein F183_A34610 [Bryobacterales bacterium F-183]|nr:hypothetical protein F183_A34610 [Bryobacterales bacterium F-183]